MHWRLLALAGVLLWGSGWAQDRTVTLQHGGLQRSYLLHAPTGYDGSTAAPLILDFHGLTSNSSQQAFVSGFRALSNRAGFLVAWPQGIGNSWNAGTGCCGNAQRDKIDDVGFARAVVEHVQSAYRVDARRVYVTGLSNGGAMTHRLAAQAADVFAAAAVFAGLLVVPANPSRPIAVISFHGYGDSTVPYAGTQFLPSAQAAIQAWSQADKCQSGPAAAILSGTNKCETWSACQGGVEAALCSLEGGHVIYQNDAGLALAERAWDFLSRFSLPQGSAVAGPGRAAFPVRTPGRAASGALTLLPGGFLPDGRKPEGSF